MIVDPYNVLGKGQSDTYNPLDFIDKDDPEAIDHCRDLAAAIVVINPEEKDRHWSEKAQTYIAGACGAVVQFCPPEHRSLQAVCEILANAQLLDAMLAKMKASDAWDGLLARLAHEMSRSVDKEREGILSTALRHLSFLSTVAMMQNTRASTFDYADLKRKPMSVFIILPPHHMRAQSPWLRLQIASALRSVVGLGLGESPKVHAVCDEAASLGPLDPLEDAVDKYRGYGVRCQFYYQSMGQLQKCWPGGQDQTLLSNCSQVFFGVNDLPTAQYVSQRLGSETIVVESESEDSGTSTSPQQVGEPGGGVTHTSSKSVSLQQQGRELLKPDEVMALDPRQAITFTPGIPPLMTRLIRYYEEPGMGAAPGRWRGFVAGVRTLAASVVVLALALGSSAVLWGTAGMIQEQVESGRPAAPPGPTPVPPPAPFDPTWSP